MIMLFKKANCKGFFFCLMLVASFFLNACASYKAEPLEDFTKTNDSQSERPKNNNPSN